MALSTTLRSFAIGLGTGVAVAVVASTPAGAERALADASGARPDALELASTEAPLETLVSWLSDGVELRALQPDAPGLRLRPLPTADTFVALELRF